MSIIEHAERCATRAKEEGYTQGDAPWSFPSDHEMLEDVLGRDATGAESIMWERVFWLALPEGDQS